MSFANKALYIVAWGSAPGHWCEQCQRRIAAFQKRGRSATKETLWLSLSAAELNLHSEAEKERPNIQYGF